MTDLARRIGGGTERRAVHPWSRLAFAGAVTTLILGMFASLGGIGYAASGADQTYKAVKTIVATHHITVHRSAAAAQYPGTPPAPSHPSGTAGQSVAQAQGVAGAGQSGTLPFTGISLLATVLVSLALIAVGLVLRRSERMKS